MIATGKSSLLKTLCLRLGAYGLKWSVPADTKGAMASLAKAVGVGHAALGPGLEQALSPLYAPLRPEWMGEEEYRQQIHQHRMTLLKSYSIEIALRFCSMFYGALQGVFDGDPMPLTLGWDLIQTDSRMRDEGGEKDFEQMVDAAAIIRACQFMVR